MELNALLPQVLDIATRIAGAITVWVIGRLAMGVLLKGAAAGLSRGSLDPTLQRWALSILGILLNIVLILAILSVFGIETTSFAALVAAAGLAIGAAWGGLLANFAAGVFLILFKPFKVGDTVTIADVTGVVAEIGVFSTAIDTEANVRTIIGNGAISGGKIENYSVNPFRLVEATAQLQHGFDALALMEALKSELASIPGVLASPEPAIQIAAINEFGPLLKVSVAAPHQLHDDVHAAILARIARAAAR